MTKPIESDPIDRKQLAKDRKISVNKLIEEMATIALTAYDAENHFRALAAKGNPQRALQLLDNLDERETG